MKNDQTFFKKTCGVNSTGFLKYVWPIIIIRHERVNPLVPDVH